MKIDNFEKIINYISNYTDSSAFDTETVKYGLQVFIYNLFTIILLFTLSIAFNNIIFGLIFILFFCILRIVIGGFHCKTIIGCTSLMIFIYSIINFLSKNNLYQDILYYISILLILIILFIKPYAENTLNLKTKLKYYRNILIIFFIITFLFFDNATVFFTAVFSALFITEIMYVLNYLTS